MTGGLFNASGSEAVSLDPGPDLHWLRCEVQADCLHGGREETPGGSHESHVVGCQAEAGDVFGDMVFPAVLQGHVPCPLLALF